MSIAALRGFTFRSRNSASCLVPRAQAEMNKALAFGLNDPKVLKHARAISLEETAHR
jgi:hypothetical protein